MNKEKPNFFVDGVETYKDIDIETLERLTVCDLRNLAFKVGVCLPMSQTDTELMAEIRKIVEREMEYIT